MTYINWKPNGNNWRLETVDEFETRAEARLMLEEYRMAFNEADKNIYLSRRCTQDWRDKS